MPGGMTDPLVVSSEDLRRVLLPIGAAEVRRQVGDDAFAVVDRLLRPESYSQTTALGAADSILTACGLSHCLADGSVPVYRNPYWSRETWEREMRARGVDDPWEIVADERPQAEAA